MYGLFVVCNCNTFRGTAKYISSIWCLLSKLDFTSLDIWWYYGLLCLLLLFGNPAWVQRLRLFAVLLHTCGFRLVISRGLIVDLPGSCCWVGVLRLGWISLLLACSFAIRVAYVILRSCLRLFLFVIGVTTIFFLPDPVDNN